MNTSHTNNYQHRSIKIDVPRFDGTNIFGWVFKIEQFFQFYKTLDDQRIMISSFHLKGLMPRNPAYMDRECVMADGLPSKLTYLKLVHTHLK